MTIGNIQIKNKYIWITIGVVGSIIVLLLINWLINSSFIEVNITNGESGSYKYNFLNQSSNKNTEIVSNNPQTKQLLPTNSYSVLIQQNYRSFFSVVKTGKFLANTYIEDKLVPENKREFIGNNPGQCMSYVNSVLVTFGCNDLLENALVHIPATPNLPTYSTTTRGKGPAGYYEGIFETKDGSFALSHIPNSEEYGQTHILNKLGANFQSIEAINISTLNPSIRYSAVKFKNGFIAFNDSFSDIQYFPDTKNQSSNITGVYPDPSYTPLNLDTNSETIMTSYSKNNKTYMFFNNNGIITSITVNKKYSTVSYCGEKYLCMINNKLLDIYKINKNQLDYMYSINGVKNIINIGNDIYFANNLGIVKFNIEKRSGYITYSFGEYRYNSMIKTADGSRVVISVTNPSNNRVALLINPLDNNNDNIDKKIISLIKSGDIKNLSIYKNYISIVPNITPNNASSNITNNQVITLDQNKIDLINKNIKKMIVDSGIDQNMYKINFTIK